MDSTKNIKLRWRTGSFSQATYQVTRLQFTQLAPQKWQPAINAFRCASAVRICVDLAGVDRSEIDLTVEARRVTVRGTRTAPEPTHAQGLAVQVLALEIDYGPFERVVELPDEVEVDEVQAEQTNGFLWIYLPSKK